MRIALITSDEARYIEKLAEGIIKREVECEIALVITNKPNSRAIGVCAKYGVPCEIIDNRYFSDREEHDRAIMRKLDESNIDLVILAGYMRLIKNKIFLERYHGGMINLHLSLLPKFPGAMPHEGVHRTGDMISGYTFHFVNGDADGGNIIKQSEVFIGDCISAKEIYDRLVLESCIGLKRLINDFSRKSVRMRI